MNLHRILKIQISYVLWTFQIKKVTLCSKGIIIFFQKSMNPKTTSYHIPVEISLAYVSLVLSIFPLIGDFSTRGRGSNGKGGRKYERCKDGKERVFRFSTENRLAKRDLTNCARLTDQTNYNSAFLPHHLSLDFSRPSLYHPNEDFDFLRPSSSSFQTLDTRRRRRRRRERFLQWLLRDIG